MTDLPEVVIRSRADLRDGLAAHHGMAGSVWMVTYKKHTDHYVPFMDLVAELLCWGWVDSVTRGVDAERSSVRISPRNPKSAWSAVNKALVAEARARAQTQARASGASQTPAREALIAQEGGMWSFLDDVERLEVPEDLAAALGDQRKGWEGYLRSVKRRALEWIKTAKTAPTRAKRIADVADSLRAGLRPSPFRR